MFSRPILFIVGAGANAEFGLPTGAELKKLIGKAVNFSRDQGGLLIGDKNLFSLLGNRQKHKVDVHYNAGLELSALLMRLYIGFRRALKSSR
jgi:hypothetical protein